MVVNILCSINRTHIHSKEYGTNIARVLRLGYRGEYTMHHLQTYIYTKLEFRVNITRVL